MKKMTTTALALAVSAMAALPVSAAESMVDATESTVEAAASFPLTLEHALGETVLDAQPERVVALGWGNVDVPLALGVAPVGVSKPSYGAADENGLFSWTNKAYEELGVEPNVFDDTDGLDFEAIANAEPDAILAVYSGITEEDYQQLSEIAPTVPYTEEAWATS